jgi:murein DD-endopeptidase MepM/ murein hydrolase activator NlpD
MHIILVKKSLVKNCYLYVTRSVLVPSVFLSLLLLGSVPYAAYHSYKGGHHAKPPHASKKWSSSSKLNTTVAPAGQTNPTLADNSNTLASRLEHLQTEVTRLDSLGKKLVTRSAKEPDASLSWDEVIAQEQSGGNPNRREALHRRLAQQAPANVLNLSTTKKMTPVIANNEEDDLVEEPVLNCHSSTTPHVLSEGWPLRVGYLSSCYGWRGHRMHKGVDIATKYGSDVLAVEDGVITFAGRMRGYGNMVEIKHGDMYTTRYGHNSKNLVAVGDTIKKGQVIASAGATGRATGVHIHFEVRQEGVAINPANYLTAISNVKLSDNILLSKK